MDYDRNHNYEIIMILDQSGGLSEHTPPTPCLRIVRRVFGLSVRSPSHKLSNQ